MEKVRIGVIGTGYVGLVTGASFANIGFEVMCLDVVEKKVNMINQAIPPIFENGLQDLLTDVVKERKLLTATLNRRETLEKSDVIFIALPTPSSADGSIDLTYIKSEVEELGKELRTMDGYKTFVVKSTVIPGTTKNVVLPLLEKYSGKKAGIDFGLAMNPEFLMEGLAISNFQKPDRVVIGAIDDRSFNEVKKLYLSFNCEIQQTTTSGAEMIKYAANSFLATKISYINEIANICEELGIDVSEVAYGLGLDERISPKFLRAGLGFGGSCFPKDVKALYALSKDLNRTSKILSAVLGINELQPMRAIQLLEGLMDIKGKRVALLGLAFKPDTDDMREAPSIVIANELLSKGAVVVAYDPIAKDTAMAVLPNITHSNSAEEALKDADAVIVVTEWKEFNNLSSKDFAIMRGKNIIDGRRVLDWKELINNGFNVKVIGQSPP